MGKKGDKMTPDSAIVEQIFMAKVKSLKEVTSKKMFGGFGLFHDSKMFGMVTAKGQCYLKVNETNLDQYIAAKSEKHSRMPYYSIPDEVMENGTTLKKWVKTSIKISKG